LITQRPNDLVMRAEIARLKAESGEMEAAMKEITGLVTLRPTDARLLMVAGDIYFQDKPDAAATYYRKALEGDPANNRARVQLGASLVRSTQYEAALPVLMDALSREADNPAAHANLATAFFKLQRYPEAAREFIWLIRAKPETSASYFFLAISLDHLGDCYQALRAYQEFVRRADAKVNKNEIDDANIKISLIQKATKEGKCKPPAKGKGK
jgi:predicted Zn-dependent protease